MALSNFKSCFLIFASSASGFCSGSGGGQPLIRVNFHAECNAGADPKGGEGGKDHATHQCQLFVTMVGAITPAHDLQDFLLLIGQTSSEEPATLVILLDKVVGIVARGEIRSVVSTFSILIELVILILDRRPLGSGSAPRWRRSTIFVQAVPGRGGSVMDRVGFERLQRIGGGLLPLPLIDGRGG
ncbi:hypothetical protein IE53DRAFT_142904 [Violaceomyces palustris]|uniref:Uncharacterized protein n=1 Tax=Violaceomyces palustris TaxID=1673888 RepID=A0ACD0NUF9_9BASI|nr:hypothetical protein IE53DRAFT_142904 [Violaceomyces palustris]